MVGLRQAAWSQVSAYPHAHSDRYRNATTHAHANRDSNANRYTHADEYAHPNANGDENPDLHRDSNTVGVAGDDACANAHPNSYAHPD